VRTVEAMRELGARVGHVARPGDRFLLEGPFGAGKTTFVQGLARGLDVSSPVSSPSFVIETQHRGRLMLYHVDLYRLERVDEELREALEEHLYGDGVTAVEWAERLPAALREDGVRVRFEAGDDDARLVSVDGADARIAQALQA
jgi:tRNA threonylcarbamoyladenosine biosynthesis protein TsaE